MTPQSRCLLVLTVSPVPTHHPLEAITEPGFFPGLMQSLSEAYLTLIQWSSRALYKSVPTAMTPTEDFCMLARSHSGHPDLGSYSLVKAELVLKAKNSNM